MASDNLRRIYSSAYEEFKKIAVKKNGIDVQTQFVQIWQENIKTCKGKPAQLGATKILLQTYRKKSSINKAKNILNFLTVRF